MKQLPLLLVLLLGLQCKEHQVTSGTNTSGSIPNEKLPKVSLVILGTIQDAGSPHIACKKACCEALFRNPDPNRKVTSLGLIDPGNDKAFLIEATPNIASQIKELSRYSGSGRELPSAIFITHAHIGHYSGLMYLGKEATNANEVPVYGMPEMNTFLENNGPWSQLVTNKNIDLRPLESGKEADISPSPSVSPFIVPHRDEFSETVGFFIEGRFKKALFIPDIDKWEKWEIPLADAISSVDYAFLDGTFYDAEEVNYRDISEIPHPFIIETMELLESLSESEKNKVYFIHFNHTNPVLDKSSEAYKTVIEKGFQLAEIGKVFEL